MLAVLQEGESGFAYLSIYLFLQELVVLFSGIPLQGRGRFEALELYRKGWIKGWTVWFYLTVTESGHLCLAPSGWATACLGVSVAAVPSVILHLESIAVLIVKSNGGAAGVFVSDL